MAIILALEKLFDDVEARLTSDGYMKPRGPLAPSGFGWRQPSRQEVPGSRIVWVPGDDSSGVVGKLGPAKYPGRQPIRPLATLTEEFTVYISGQDPTAPEDERKQYHATRILYDAWIRAVYLSAYGTFAIESQDWVIDKNQRRYGTAIRVLGTIQAVIPDSVGELGPEIDEQGVGADIPVDELDVTENVVVAPNPYV